MYRRRIQYRSPPRPVSGPFDPAEVAPSETEISPPRPVSGPFDPAEVAPSETEIRPEFQLRDRVARRARQEALVNSTILNICSPDVYIAGSACEQLAYLLLADNAKYLAGKENALILCCVRQLRLLRNVKARMTSTNLHQFAPICTTILSLVLAVYDVEAMAKKISKYVLQALIYQLFTLLVDGHFVFTDGINILIAQIVEKSDHTKVSSALINLLRDCSLNTSTSTRFTKLVMKSLWKVVKLFPTWEDTDLSVILYDVHLFMKDLPSPSWKNRYTDAPFRTIKTFLHTMTTIEGNKIFHYLGRIDNTNESELHSYLVKLLKKAAEVPDKNSEEMPAGINSPDTSTDGSEFSVLNDSSKCDELSFKFNTLIIQGTPENSYDKGSDTGTENENSESPCATSEKAAEVPDKNSEEMPAGINSPDTLSDDSMCTVIHRSLRNVHNSIQDSEFSDDKGSDTGTKNENSESQCATSEGSGQSGEGTAPGASFSGDRYVADDHQVVEESDDHLRGLNLNTLEQLRNSIETRPHENVFSDEPKGLKESVELMPHQKQALAWLMWREKQIPSGGILADDKGLGTTLTMISLILKTKEEDESDESGESKVGGTLVICRASLLNQWEGEVAAKCRTDVLKLKVYHGPKRDEDFIGYDMIITSYNIVQNECSKRGKLFKINWKRIILDDALVVRNYKNKTSSAVFQLKAKYRWAVTGAPIHNNNDLYAIIIFFLKYSPFDVYSDWCRLVDNKNASSLQQLETIRDTLMLRRTKEQLQTL